VNNTIKILRKLGLNKKEAKIYLSLIKSGPGSVQDISRSTSINRSTIYQRLENLKGKGLVIFEKGEKGIIIRAIHPSKIEEVIKKKVTKAKKLQNEYKDILPNLLSLFQPETAEAKFMHFEGVKGLRRMIYDFEMEAQDKNLYGYTTIKITNILGNKFIKKYHKKFFEKEYIDHFIISDNEENEDYIRNVTNSKLFKRKRIIVKTLPKDIFNPSVSVSIYDDKYAISLMKEGIPFGVIIQNAEIADHQMEVFRILWEKAKEI